MMPVPNSVAHTPKLSERSCISCRTKADKRNLLRIVRTAAGEIDFDSSGRSAGRGAYLCASSACIEMAYKKRLLDRALKIKLSEDDYARLAANIADRAVQNVVLEDA